jgi:hypothetical protein
MPNLTIGAIFSAQSETNYGQKIVSIRKRTWTTPDGSTKTAWLVDYRDQAGKRRAKQFALKKAAEAWSTNARAEVQRGVHTPDSASITVEAAAKLWLDTVRANGREPTTIAAYDQHVRLHILPKCGATKLSQLTAPKVRAILDEWMMHQSRPMALRLLRSLKAIITEAQERGLVAQNVALAVKPRKVSRESPRPHRRPRQICVQFYRPRRRPTRRPGPWSNSRSSPACAHRNCGASLGLPST